MTDDGNDAADQDLIGRFEPAHQSWARGVQATLLWKDTPSAQIDRELIRVLNAVNDSAQNPHELFGEPIDYARQRAIALRPAEQVARREMPLESMRSLMGGAGLVIGLLIAGFGLYVAFRDGWLAQSWQVWQLACLVAGAGIAGAGHAFWYLRLSARLRAALLVLLGGLVGALGCAALLLTLGSERVLPMPNLVGPILGLVLLVGFFLLPLTEADSDPIAVAGAKQWFALAERFLRGRYGFTRAEARAALSVARSHWEQVHAHDPAADPNEEFGPPAQFVVSLAALQEGPVRRRWWLKQVLYLLIPSCFVIAQLAEIMGGGVTWWSISTLAFWLAVLGLSIYLMRPTARSKDISEKLAERRRDAQVIGAGVEDD
ncbi:hypothetical protein [Glutamicibacter uratoxydans]|uniref:hypothetical protein n=1 Tax=Glutamicibacter uratoxydans TaxID=43667 RepID=UPI003D6DC72A